MTDLDALEIHLRTRLPTRSDGQATLALIAELRAARAVNGDLVEALRALNSRIWLDNPSWAIAVPETLRATELIAAFDRLTGERQ